MPAEVLFVVQEVHLNTPPSKIFSCDRRKAICNVCKEEIIDQREVIREGFVLCRSCAGHSFFQAVKPAVTTLASNVI